MSKLSYTTLATLSFFAITGCDQASKSPSGEATSAAPPAQVVNAPLAKVDSAPLAQLDGGTGLPKFSEWIPTTPTGVKITAAEGKFVVDGDNSSAGYQITSPVIVVKPESNFIVRIDYTVESGTVCPGILTESQGAWIVPPASVTTDLRFNSGSNKGIYVVMANCSQQQQGNSKSKFHLRSAVIASATK
jgi:hypothetical protein